MQKFILVLTLVLSAACAKVPNNNSNGNTDSETKNIVVSGVYYIDQAVWGGIDAKVEFRIDGFGNWSMRLFSNLNNDGNYGFYMDISGQNDSDGNLFMWKIECDYFAPNNMRAIFTPDIATVKYPNPGPNFSGTDIPTLTLGVGQATKPANWPTATAKLCPLVNH